MVGIKSNYFTFIIKDAGLKHSLRIIATVHCLGKNMTFNKIRVSSKSSFFQLEIMSAPNVYSPHCTM